MNLLIRNFTKEKISSKFLEKIVDKFLQIEGIKCETEISLVFAGEKRIKKINKACRGINRSTDVLSFEGGDDEGFVSAKDDFLYLGEIFICVPVAKRQAKAHSHSFKKEISVLLVHGLFHLLGYDHIDDKDYEIMNRKEKELLGFLYN
jgi:probable rRNA maturation factor